jgi:hypothetical protein
MSDPSNISPPALSGHGAIPAAVSIISKLSGAVFIPSVANIVFNIMSYFFDHHRIKLPPPPASVYDVSVGCAFSLIGIAITTPALEITRHLILLFVFLLFLILGGFIIPVFSGWPKLYIVWVINIISIFVLSWAVVATD